MTRQKNKVFVQQATSFERYAKVLKQLGFPIKPEFTKLDYSAFCETQKGTNETWVGIAPFAKHPAKVYPMEKMEQVIKALSERENTTVFLFGGGDEEKRQITALCAQYPNVKPAQSLQGLKGELALMGQLDVPYAGFLGWNQNPHDCVQLEMSCRPCSVYGNKRCMRGDYMCMNGITLERILKKLSPYLK